MAESILIPKADYGQVSGQPGQGLTSNWVPSKVTPKEVIYKDTIAPLGRPNTVRFAVSPIKNIYSGLAIASDAQYPIKSGQSILIQVNEIATVTGTADGIDKNVPLSAHVVLKVPDLNGQLFSNAAVYELGLRVLTATMRASLDETPTTLISRADGYGYLRRGVLSY